MSWPPFEPVPPLELLVIPVRVRGNIDEEEGVVHFWPVGQSEGGLVFRRNIIPHHLLSLAITLVLVPLLLLSLLVTPISPRPVTAAPHLPHSKKQ